MKMLEKLNELNGEIIKRLNERDFKVEDPHIMKGEKFTSLRCDIVIDDMKFYAYMDDNTKGISAFCSNMYLPSMEDEDKKKLVKYIWMESSSIILARMKDEQNTLNKIIEKID